MPPIASNGKPRQSTERSRLERAGISARAERWLNLGLILLVLVFASGWVYAVARAAQEGTPTPRIASATVPPLTTEAPPATAFLLDAALRLFTDTAALRGESGQLRIIVVEGDSLLLPDSLPSDVSVSLRGRGDTVAMADSLARVAARPGIWDVLLSAGRAVRTVPDLAVITLVPLSEKRGGRIGAYRIGSWPFEAGGRPPSPAYAPPAGLVRVTLENQDLRVSRHFRLRDFLTKGQADVWPKYVALSPRLLDKLELTIDELAAMGHPVQHVGVISGFRTPTYNESGGNPAGRGALSRHMYGDAMDFFVDNDRDFRMDDLNGDGRINTGDGRVMVRAAERVEQKYPHLVGGIGLYAPSAGHSGFVHIDTRGYRARW